jgi:hypothetical protein
MRTTYFVMLGIAFAIAAMMMQMSGLAAFFDAHSSNDHIASTAEGVASKNAPIEKGLEGSPKAGQDGLVGFVFSAASGIQQIFKMAVAMPTVLLNHGFPRYFSYPVGLGIDLALWVGFAQFITGRRYY